MALNTSNLDLVFTEGLNTKNDSKLTLKTSLLKLENAVMTKLGAFSKRNGYTVLSTADSAGTAISNHKALLKTDQELLLAADNTLYSYSQSSSQWVSKNNLTSASVELQAIVANSSEQTKMDTCTNAGITAYAWEDSRGGIRYSVQDETTGTFLVYDQVVDASGDTPRCVAMGNTLAIIYGDSTSLKCKYLTTGSPTTLTATTIVADLHADHLFDFVSDGTKAHGFYKNSAATTGSIVTIGSDCVLDNVIDFTSTTIVDTLTVVIHEVSGLSYLTLAWKEDADTIRTAIYTTSLYNEVAAKDLDATVGTDIEKIVGCEDSTTAGSIRFFYQSAGSTSASDYITTNTITLGGTVGTPAEFKRSVGIASKPFLYENSLFINVLHESDLQATVFTLDLEGNIIAKFAAGNAGTHAGVGALPSSINSLGSGKFSAAINVKGTIRSENATLFSLLGVSSATVDFESSNTYSFANLNQNMHVTGGILKTYDGGSAVEQGFQLFPEGTTIDTSATTGGNLTDGAYAYAVVYTWTDARGNIHRSAPEFLSVTLSGGGSTQKPVLTIPTLRLTEKTGSRAEVTIDVYRTEVNQAILYKRTTVASPLENDTTVDTVTFTDDTALSPLGSEILYTTGGVLDNISAPSCDFITTFNNRIFIAGLQNKNEIRYSKIVRSGEGIAFNEALSISVDARGGDITQLAAMDSNLIIFKRDNIYRLAGQGPSDTGTGGTFTEPDLVSTDVGCTEKNSVVLGPNGLYFKSAKGIYLLDRSLQVSYIGAEVEDFNSQTIVSSQLLDDVNEIRFYTSEGTTLVYNYFFQLWSTFTNQPAIDAVVWDNTLTYLREGGLIYREAPGTYLDNATPYSMKVATGWVNLNGIQGFQRARRATVLGEYISRHLLNVDFYYDYSTPLVQRSTFIPNDILSVDAGFYGDGVYGDLSVYGSDDNGVYQFETHLKRQKCQAVRVEISDVISNADDYGSGASLNITGVTFQVGTKRGGNKLPGSKVK